MDQETFPGLFYVVMPSTPNSGEYLLRNMDGDQRRRLLPQLRGRRLNHGHERVAGDEYPQRAAGQAVSTLCFYYGRRHAVVSRAD